MQLIEGKVCRCNFALEIAGEVSSGNQIAVYIGPGHIAKIWTWKIDGEKGVYV